jgi:hypothetical protein
MTLTLLLAASRGDIGYALGTVVGAVVGIWLGSKTVSALGLKPYGGFQYKASTLWLMVLLGAIIGVILGVKKHRARTSLAGNYSETQPAAAPAPASDPELVRLLAEAKRQHEALTKGPQRMPTNTRA